MDATVNFDKPRELKFTLAALRKFKAAAGIPLWKVFQEDEHGGVYLFQTEILTTVIWAGLLHEEPKLTFEKAEALFQGYVDAKKDLADIPKAVLAAMDESGLFGSDKKPKGAAAEVPNG